MRQGEYMRGDSSNGKPMRYAHPLSFATATDEWIPPQPWESDNCWITCTPWTQTQCHLSPLHCRLRCSQMPRTQCVKPNPSPNMLNPTPTPWAQMHTHIVCSTITGIHKSPESNTLNLNPTPPVLFASLPPAFVKAQNPTHWTQLAVLPLVCHQHLWKSRSQCIEPHASCLAVIPGAQCVFPSHCHSPTPPCSHWGQHWLQSW